MSSVVAFRLGLSLCVPPLLLYTRTIYLAATKAISTLPLPKPCAAAYRFYIYMQNLLIEIRLGLAWEPVWKIKL